MVVEKYVVKVRYAENRRREMSHVFLPVSLTSLPPPQKKELGIPVGMTTGVHDRPKHPAEAMVNARALLEACDDWALAALQSVAMECKSLIIALAVAFRKTTVEKVRKFFGGKKSRYGKKFASCLRCEASCS